MYKKPSGKWYSWSSQPDISSGIVSSTENLLADRPSYLLCSLEKLPFCLVFLFCFLCQIITKSCGNLFLTDKLQHVSHRTSSTSSFQEGKRMHPDIPWYKLIMCSVIICMYFSNLVIGDIWAILWHWNTLLVLCWIKNKELLLMQVWFFKINTFKLKIIYCLIN